MLEHYDLTIKRCLIPGTQENYFRSIKGGGRRELEILMDNAIGFHDWPIMYFVFQGASVSDRRLKKVELIISYRDTGVTTSVLVGAYKLKVYRVYKQR